MRIEDQMMLKVIEHEELKALDAFGKWYKIVADSQGDHNTHSYNAADEELGKARATLLFWMKERATFNPYAMCA